MKLLYMAEIEIHMDLYAFNKEGGAYEDEIKLAYSPTYGDWPNPRSRRGLSDFVWNAVRGRLGESTCMEDTPYRLTFRFCGRTPMEYEQLEHKFKTLFQPLERWVTIK